MLPQELSHKVRLIEITTRKVVTDVLSGQYRSQFKGQGVQFSEHRPYVPGDDVRHINWNVSARTREPLVKKFDEERQLTVFLVIDVSGSQRFGSSTHLKSEVVAEVGGMLAYAASHTGDRVGVLLFADQIEHIIPPQKGRHHVLRIIRNLLTYQPKHSPPQKNPQNPLTTALDAAGRIMKQRGVVFVISDFIEGAYETALKRLARKHDVIAIAITDEREKSLPKIGKILVFNPETGQEAILDTSSATVQKWIQDFDQQRNKTLELVSKSSHIQVLKILTQENYGDAVVRFFRTRAHRKR